MFCIKNQTNWRVFFFSSAFYQFAWLEITSLQKKTTFLHMGAVLIVWQLDLQLPVQSAPITSNAVSLNPTVVSSHPIHGKVYRIQHYVVKLVSDLQQIGGFLCVLRFPLPIKLTANITLHPPPPPLEENNLISYQITNILQQHCIDMNLNYMKEN